MLGKIRIVPDMKNRCRIDCEDVEFAEMIRQSFMYVNRYIGAGQNTYESTECPITLNYTFRIGLTFDIAKRAKEKKVGARALRAIIEEFMLDIMYEIPKDDNIGKVTITEEYIEKKGGPRIEMRGTLALEDSQS